VDWKTLPKAAVSTIASHSTIPFHCIGKKLELCTVPASETCFFKIKKPLNAASSDGHQDKQ